MIKEREPKVAIVIVNWNKKDYVLNLLSSLQKIDYNNHDIIVVDNASTDGSVEAIRAEFPYVYLIVNKENLGGTGGFNTGLKYVLDKGDDYKYIWLLDNDAEVERSTLRELVSVMEVDEKIGIAGSRIMSTERKELIVELGGFIDWRSMTWQPNLRYFKEKEYTGPNIVNVDYVAACSALVRKEAIKLVGLMDNRFFLHWDDIDLCIRIKKVGFKVISVFRSKVYHSVEKGFNPQVLYYDFRNGLLIISKHLKGLKRLLSILSILRTSSEAFLFFIFEKKFFEAKQVLFAIYDFCLNNFGKIKRNIKTNTHSFKYANSEKADHIKDLIKKAKKILIFQDGSYDEVREAISAIRKLSPDANISLLVQKDKKNLFKDSSINSYITFDLFKESYIKRSILFLKLLFSNFNLGINTNPTYNLPYVYCIRKNITYIHKTDSFIILPNNIFSLWKIVLATLLGNIMGALLFTPIVYLFSFRYKE